MMSLKDDYQVRRPSAPGQMMKTYTWFLPFVCGFVLSAQGPTVTVTVSNAKDLSKGAAGQVQTFLSTSVSPFDGFSTGTVSLLSSQSPQPGPPHLRVQVTKWPTFPMHDPQLDAFMKDVLVFGDHSPELQIGALVGVYNQNNTIDPVGLANFAMACQNLVAYYNSSNFTASDLKHYPITWWGMLNEPAENTTSIDGRNYATIYNAIASAMLEADSTIKFVAGELAYYTNDIYGPAYRFVSQFVGSVTAPVNAFAIHYYPAGCPPATKTYSTAFTDTVIMNEIPMPGKASDIAALYAQLQTNPNLKDVPVWITENNISSEFNTQNVPGCTYYQDPRVQDGFFTAWRPYLYSQFVKAGTSSSQPQLFHHWYFASPNYQDLQFTEVDGANSTPNRPHWVDRYLSDFITPGQPILVSTNSNSDDVEELAVTQTDGSIVVMLVNHAPGGAGSNDFDLGGAPLTVNLKLSGFGPLTSATEWMIDNSTPLIDGPPAQALPPQSQIMIPFQGYGVAFVRLYPNVGTPIVIGTSVTSGNASTQNFAFTFSHSAGYQSLAVVNVLINNVLDGRHACYLAYSLPASTLYLVDDAGDAGGPFAGGVGLGNPGTAIQNSQCSVNLTSAVGSGNRLTLVLAIAFKTAFGGTKIQYLAARDNSGGNTDWQGVGVWQVPPVSAGQITVTSLAPAWTAAPSGTAQTLTAVLTDTKGTVDFGVINVLANKFIDGRQACYIAYVAAANTLYLVDDAGDAGGPFAGGIVLNGGGGNTQNSQCSISGTGSSAVPIGNTLTLTLNLTFKGAFGGNRIVWVAGRDTAGGNNTDWQAMGTQSVQ
jgi:hypothetical protein